MFLGTFPRFLHEIGPRRWHAGRGYIAKYQYKDRTSALILKMSLKVATPTLAGSILVFEESVEQIKVL